MDIKKEIEQQREAYRAKHANYDKWAKFKYRWWNKEDIPKIPDFSGKEGSMFKWPSVKNTGNLTIPYMDPDDRLKIVNNTWRNCFFMQWHVMQEEIGKEKADELVGYMWLAMVAAMEGLNDRYFKGQPRDCVMLSKQWQIDCFYEMHDQNIVEESPKKVVIQALCTYWADWVGRWKAKGIDIKWALCELGCRAWCKEWAYGIDPKMTCQRTKWLVDGDSCCEYTFEIKD
jgi:hypothetical protein